MGANGVVEGSGVKGAEQLIGGLGRRLADDFADGLDLAGSA